jgi:hypothetical protein
VATRQGGQLVVYFTNWKNALLFFFPITRDGFISHQREPPGCARWHLQLRGRHLRFAESWSGGIIFAAQAPDQRQDIGEGASRSRFAVVLDSVPRGRASISFEVRRPTMKALISLTASLTLSGRVATGSSHGISALQAHSLTAQR